MTYFIILYIKYIIIIFTNFFIRQMVKRDP